MTAAAHRATLAPATIVSSSGPAARRGEPSSIERAIALTALTVLLLLNVALPSWSVASFPVRGMLAVALLVLLAIWYADRFVRAVERFLPILVLAFGLAALGTFLSIVNGASADVIVSTLLEVHLQIIVTVLLAGLLADLCGTRACVIALVGVVGLSAIVAILQMLDVSAAWQARAALGRFQGQAQVLDPLEPWRPRGLSYSPIQLTTQLCIAFAAFTAWRGHQQAARNAPRSVDPAIIGALAAFVFVCIASGTRSPIAGAAIFFILYTMTRRASAVPVIFAASAALLYWSWPFIAAALQSTQPRVLQIQDDSVWNRFTLVRFGLRLFAENPLGYGFDFKPYEMWMAQWRDLYLMPGARAVQSKELHNYIVSMLNTYGIGLFLFAPMVARLLKRAGAALLFFTPYILHIMFHNAGPFWNDNIIWFAIAALPAGAAVSARRTRLRSGPAAWRQPRRPEISLDTPTERPRATDGPAGAPLHCPGGAPAPKRYGT